MRVQKSQGHSSSQVKGTLGRREESTETPVRILDSDVNTMPRVFRATRVSAMGRRGWTEVGRVGTRGHKDM